MKLEARGLIKTFPDGSRGLAGTDLSLETPCFAVLSGRNGCGKSLLARHFLGLERPDAGEILLDGRPLGTCLAEARRRIALVFQEPEHQILGVTVREDVEFGPRAAGLPREQYAALAVAALQQAGLAGFEDRLASALSGGEKRRLAVASSLVSAPELVILDEPFNDLDWKGASDLIDMLLDLRAAGTGILVLTHDLEKCLAHADRLVVMDQGRVVRDGTPAGLWNELPGLGLRRLAGGQEKLVGMTWSTCIMDEELAGEPECAWL
ncbi:MAG: ABC transporter ATP-binding protein [Spirochaetia bacterium]|jgi:energy-coupling factor transporter ATP-binding protein EcfA2|nr:ABC transporter ATP-binding protein [Spirochaetia bacterium]